MEHVTKKKGYSFKFSWEKTLRVSEAESDRVRAGKLKQFLGLMVVCCAFEDVYGMTAAAVRTTVLAGQPSHEMAIGLGVSTTRCTDGNRARSALVLCVLHNSSVVPGQAHRCTAEATKRAVRIPASLAAVLYCTALHCFSSWQVNVACVRAYIDLQCSMKVMALVAGSRFGNTCTGKARAERWGLVLIWRQG